MKKRSNPGLRALRIAKKLSQDELGFRAKISQARLSRAERGYLNLSDEERIRISVELDADPNDLDKDPIKLEGEPTLEQLLEGAPAVLNAIEQRASAYASLGQDVGGSVNDDALNQYREKCRQQLLAVFESRSS